MTCRRGRKCVELFLRRHGDIIVRLHYYRTFETRFNQQSLKQSEHHSNIPDPSSSPRELILELVDSKCIKSQIVYPSLQANSLSLNEILSLALLTTRNRGRVCYLCGLAQLGCGLCRRM